MHEVVEALRHSATFTGRARRRAFWLFVLTATLLSSGLSLIDEAIGFQPIPGDDGLLVNLLTLALLIPALAVTARRLHDTGRSGWTQLVVFVPVLGWFALLVWLAEGSAPGSNRWGRRTQPSPAPVQHW